MPDVPGTPHHGPSPAQDAAHSPPGTVPAPGIAAGGPDPGAVIGEPGADPGAVAAEPGAGTDRISVTRSVELPADPGTVWDVVADPHERGHWLDDPDAAGRSVRIEESDPERELVWTWWSPGDESGASTVDLRLTPTGRGTRVTVVETWPAAAPPGPEGVQAHAGALSAGLAAHGRWTSRLLALELLLLLAGVPAR